MSPGQGEDDDPVKLLRLAVQDGARFAAWSCRAFRSRYFGVAQTYKKIIVVKIIKICQSLWYPQFVILQFQES